MLTSPSLFAAGIVWAELGSLKKQETTQAGGNSQEMSLEHVPVQRFFLLVGMRRRHLLPVMMNHTECCSHLRRVAGDGRALTGAEPGGGDAWDRPLGGKGRRRVDEGRTVAKGGAHDARLTANQLLVHVQSHGGWRVSEA